MSAYIAQLRREVDEEKRLHEIKAKAQAEATTVKLQERCVKPLTVQITELMSTIPPSMRDRPWSIQDLVSRLQGKYRDRPHTQHVGSALRQLGWCRERRWGHGYDGVRVWMPPAR